MNRQRILILADILDGTANYDGAPSPHDPPGFAMSSFYRPGTDFCGATACLAGHAILAFGTSEQCDALRASGPMEDNYSPTHIAEKLLDLPHHSPLWYLWDLRRNSRAAALLLRDLATCSDAEIERLFSTPPGVSGLQRRVDDAIAAADIAAAAP